MDSDKKKNQNIGCIIAITIFVIAILIYLFIDDNGLIASTGESVLLIAGLVIAFFICKTLFGNNNANNENSDNNIDCNETNKKQSKQKSSLGCILTGVACIVIFATVTTALTSSSSTNYIVGAIVITIVCIGLGILIYKSSKD